MLYCNEILVLIIYVLISHPLRGYHCAKVTQEQHAWGTSVIVTFGDLV